MRLDFYFDFSCPYAYLGSTQIVALAKRHGVALTFRPMLLGGVFRSRGTPQNMSEGMAVEKAKHNHNDMHRWASLWHVPLTVPKSHPMRTVAALRALLSVDESQWPALITSIFEEYWTRGGDISDPAVLTRCLTSAGLSPAACRKAIEANGDQTIKEELRRRTDVAIAAGVFGAPTVFAKSADGHREMFWGQDRLWDLESHLTNHGYPAVEGSGKVLPPLPGQARAEASNPATTEHLRLIEFYFDFSSPFAYLGSKMIERVAEQAGATLVWKPILLGALFREIGTPDVPIREFSEAKRSYYRRDLHRAAASSSIPFAWNPAFPIRTVTALRIALAAGDRMVSFIHEAFAAVWRDGHDLNDHQTLAEVADRAGLPSDAVSAAKTSAAKRALFEANREARAAGVFGAPTTIVHARGTSTLFWGQDRLELALRAALGWQPADVERSAKPA